MSKINIFWFRRDLRLEDNLGLSKALDSGRKVLPVFIFDTDILRQFEDKKDRRVDYIHQVLKQMNEELHQYNSGILTFFGKPTAIFLTKHLLIDWR